MLLGIKSIKIILIRHIVVGLIASFWVYLVWFLNDTWSPDMRLWKAFGGGSFFLLWFSMFIGPLSKIWEPANYLLSYRREVGIWFFLVVAVHVYLILDGWVRWNVWEFFGYKYVAQVDMYLRVESGFGLSNFAGLIALVFAFVLAATSFDRVVNYLGISSWKWLHGSAHIIFYLVVIHVLYFAFIHYMPSLLRAMQGAPSNYPDNPLKYLYLGALFSVLLLQIWAFILTVVKYKKTDW